MIFRPRRSAPTPQPEPQPEPRPAPPQTDPLVPPLADPDPAAPEPPRRRGKLRTALILLACVLAVALTATAPILMFTLGDIARFAHPAAADKPYASRTVDGDNIYLVRMLHERQEASVAVSSGQQSSGQSLYLGASFSYDSMQMDTNLSVLCSDVLRQLADGRVLPYNWISDTLAATSYDPAAFRGSSDSLGFTTIGYFPEWRSGNTSPTMNMTLESHTGKLVSLQLIAPSGADQPDTATLLDAWIQLCDLDILGDWTTPAGTRWESTGLYSARGNLLATCVVVYDGVNGQWGITMDLVPCTQDELTAAATARPLDQEPADTGPMVRTNAQSSQGSYFNSGSCLYFLQPNSDGLRRLLCLDYDTGTLRCVCQKDDCEHDSLQCPACFSRDCSIYADDSGRIYLLQPGEVSGDVIQPTLLYAIDPDGQNVNVLARLYSTGLLEPIAVRSGLLYLRQYDDTDPMYDPTPATVLAVSLTTGERSVTPTRMDNEEQVIGVYNGFLVTIRQMDGRAFRNQMLTPPLLSDWLDPQSCLEMDLLDPATGERYLISQLGGVYAGDGGGRYLADTWLVPVWVRSQAGADVSAMALWQVNLSTGETAFFGEGSLPSAVSEMVPLADWMADGKQGLYNNLPWVYLSGLTEENGTLYDAIYQTDTGGLQRIAPSLYGSWQIIAVTDNYQLVLERYGLQAGLRQMALIEFWELDTPLSQVVLEENALTLTESS